MTYVPLGGAAVPVVGIFNETSYIADRGEAGLEQTGPNVMLRLEDLPTHPDEDDPTLTINGVEYQVRHREYDGMGVVTLYLHEVSS